MDKLFDAEGLTSSERYFYTPSAFARKHLCYVQEAGRLKSLKPHTSAREELESFLFLFVESGSGVLRFEGSETELHRGWAALIDCRKHYEHESSATNPWELRWVHFDGARAEALYPLFKEQNGGSPCFALGQQEAEARELCSQILETKGDNSRMTEIRADAALGRILLLCMEQAGVRQEQETDISGMREEINESLAADKTPEEISRLLAARYEQPFDVLDEQFRKRYGITATGYIANRMLNKAKELLRFTIKPLSEVILESGIGDEESFRRLFIENENMSPEDYRKRWAQWIKG
ncbi:MAG: helix-turn-helix domain-containing protein [Lachnospiraceae bacterium]|nr:helix-turn-helix domain-containing protein [Lachnospiraceae bacterium]